MPFATFNEVLCPEALVSVHGTLGQPDCRSRSVGTSQKGREWKTEHFGSTNLQVPFPARGTVK